MKIRISEKWKDRLALPALIATLAFGGGFFRHIYLDDLANEKYRKSVASAYEQAVRIADTNQNGYLEPEESVRLARELGFEETIPTNSIVVQMYPRNRKKETIDLRVACSGSDVGGFAVGGRPIYDKSLEIKLSDIERYIQTQGENEKKRVNTYTQSRQYL